MALPPSSKYLQQPDSPVDDVERDALTARLSDAYADGRLSEKVYLRALDTVYEATTLSDLVPVVEELPAASVNVPSIVDKGSTPAGQTNQGRNIMPVALAAISATATLVAVVIVLLVILL